MIQCRLAGQEWSMEAFFTENEVKLYDVRRADNATSLIINPVVQIRDTLKASLSLNMWKLKDWITGGSDLYLTVLPIPP